MMHANRKPAALALCALIAGLCVPSANAQGNRPVTAPRVPKPVVASTPAGIRSVANRVGPCVVTVQVVAKMTVSMTGSQSSDREQKLETFGTVIDPSGLTVVALSQIDPLAVVGQFITDSSTNIRSQITDVKMLTASGTEIKATIVLRDKDQDLAFIRPTAKINPAPVWLDIKKNTPVQVADEVILVGRMSKVLNRAISTHVTRVRALVDRPRTRYVLDMQESDEFGCPVMAMDGRVVGIRVIKVLRPQGSDARARAADLNKNTMSVIVPAEDILDVMSQLPPAK